MKPYSPGEQDPNNQASTPDFATPGSGLSASVGANPLGATDDATTIEEGVVRIEPVGAMPYAVDENPETPDYTYNPAIAMADTIGAEGGNAAVETVGETSNSQAGDTGDDNYNFTPTQRGASGKLMDEGTRGKDDDEKTDDPKAIRAEIERTRSDMSATIDAIQEKLNPQNIVDQAKDNVREATIGRVENMVNDVRDTARETGSGFIDTMKQNPLPTALAAIGIGWLFMKSRSNNDRERNYGYSSGGAYHRDQYEYDRYNYGQPSRYYEQQGRGSGASGALDRAGNKISDAAGQVKDKAGNVVSQAGNTAGDAVDNVQGTMDQMGSTVQYKAEQAGGQFQRILYENPLAVGAAAVVLGALVGGLVPETEQENRLMGDARDNVLDNAQSAASKAVDKVSNVAQQATDAAKQEAKQEGLTS